MTEYYVYIMTNASKTLYTGVTNDLARRVLEHKQQAGAGFTTRYHLTRLAYYESTPDVRAALAREKQIKGWRRERKIQLIVSANPEWRDLSDGWLGAGGETLRFTQGDRGMAQGDRGMAQGDSGTAQGDKDIAGRDGAGDAS